MCHIKFVVCSVAPKFLQLHLCHDRTDDLTFSWHGPPCISLSNVRIYKEEYFLPIIDKNSQPGPKKKKYS